MSARGIRKAPHDRPPISKPSVADRGPGRSFIAALKIRERHTFIHGLVILGTLLLRRVRKGLPSSSAVFMEVLARPFIVIAIAVAALSHRDDILQYGSVAQ